MAFVLDYLFSIFLASIISGRIFHVILKWELYSDRITEVFYVWEGGINLWGALIGGVLYFWYLSWLHKQDVLVWLDQIVVALQVALIVGYIAYLLGPDGISGSSFGTPTDFFWGMNVESGGELKLHPVSLYMIFGNTLILLVLKLVSKIKRLAGLRAFSASIMQGLLILVTEPLKTTVNYTLFSVNFTIIIAYTSLALGIAGIAYVFLMNKKYRNKSKYQILKSQ